jgi:hypothetical protein
LFDLPQIAAPVKPAEFGSADWYAQTIGGGAGMVAPFLLTSKATSMLGLREAGVAKSFADGALFGAVFMPSQNDAGLGFLKDRLTSSAISGATFGMSYPGLLPAV